VTHGGFTEGGAADSTRYLRESMRYLEPLVGLTVPEENADPVSTTRSETPTLTGGLTLQLLSEVEMRSIVFLDKPLLQADAFHLLAGRKGVGKGTLLAEIAARLTRGELGDKRGVLWIGSEDSAAIDLKPRIVAAEGDPARVHVVQDGWVQLPRDLDLLDDQLRELGGVGLLVIDPVGNHIAGKNSDSESDIREAIAQLNQLADDHQCMVIGVRHLTEKEYGRGVLAAILGSSAWVQIPRAVIAAVRDNDDAEVLHVQCVAGNRLPPGTPGRMYRIEAVTLPGLENEVTRAVPIGDSGKDVETLFSNGNKQPSRSAAARELILDILEGEGDQESDALDARVANETGLTEGTVNQQRKKLSADGLVRARRETNEHGRAERWFVVRTTEPREGFR
jgi:AAA domain